MRHTKKALASSAALGTAGFSPVQPTHPDILPSTAPSAARMPPGVSHPDILPSDPKAFAELQGRNAAKDAVMSFFGPIPGSTPVPSGKPPASDKPGADDADEEIKRPAKSAISFTMKRWADEAIQFVRQAAKQLEVTEQAFENVRVLHGSTLDDMVAGGQKALEQTLPAIPGLAENNLTAMTFDPKTEKYRGPYMAVKESLFAAAWRLSRIDAPYHIRIPV